MLRGVADDKSDGERLEYSDKPIWIEDVDEIRPSNYE